MSEDSFRLLQEAREFKFSDIQPPSLAIIWHYVDLLIPGPSGMLVLNLFIFYFSIWRIFELSTAPTWRRPLYTLTLGLNPPVFGIVGAMWVDLFMASFLLLTLMLVLDFRNSKRWEAPIAFGAFISLALAISFRHNAAAAALPVLFFFVYSIFQKLNWATGKIRVASATLAASAVVVAGVKITQSSLASKHDALWQSIPIYDITGMSVKIGEDLFFPPLKKQTMDEMRLLYTFRSVTPILWGRTLHDLPERTATANPGYETKAEQKLLLHNWFFAIVHHPFAYLYHRYFVSRELLGWTPRGLWGPIFGFVCKDGLGLTKKDNHPYLTWIGKFEGNLLFKPKFYFVLLLIVLLLGYRWGMRSPLFYAVSASGLFHLAGLSLAAFSPDFRYTHWMTITSIISAYLLLDWRLQQTHKVNT